MKNVKTRSAIGLISIFLLTAALPLSSQVRFPWLKPLAVSVDMGRYDPEPNCRKEVDGCFPKDWVATTEFQAGTPVWMKVTITNRSKMAAVSTTGPKNIWIRSLVDATGTPSALTKEGCWTRDPACPYPRDNAIIMITAAPPEYWEIISRSSVTLFIEVSRDFVLQSEGEYVLSPEITGFFLTPSEKFFNPWQSDEKHAKPVAGLRMKALKFMVLAER
jgi:hypothetical protein